MVEKSANIDAKSKKKDNPGILCGQAKWATKNMNYLDARFSSQRKRLLREPPIFDSGHMTNDALQNKFQEDGPLLAWGTEWLVGRLRSTDMTFRLGRDYEDAQFDQQQRRLLQRDNLSISLHVLGDE